MPIIYLNYYVEDKSMKYAILPLAIVSAFASSAFAANVTTYGVVDTGLLYTHHNQTNLGSSDNVSMSSSIGQPTRIGLKGTENLADGYAVSFKLENSFNTDSGEFGMKGTLFNREARLSLQTPAGTFSFGRLGALTSGCGTYDIFMWEADSMDGGVADVIGTTIWFDRDRYNNMINYESPAIGGLTLYAQYTNGTTDDSVIGSRNKTRYAALGGTYQVGNLSLVAVVDTVLHQSVNSQKVEDAKTISLGGNYTFNGVKLFAGFQYGKDDYTPMNDYAEPVDGYNTHLGAAITLPCGLLQISTHYSDVETVANKNVTAKQWGVSALHTYELSKQTSIYATAGYKHIENSNTVETLKTKTFQAAIGVTHQF